MQGWIPLRQGEALLRPCASRFHGAAALAAILCLPSAQAKQYLTEEEALKKAFPAAKEILREERTLTDAQRKDAESRLGKPVGDAKRTVFVAKGEGKDGKILGYALFVDEIGKTLPITFLVAVDPSGAILGFELVEFRESRGDGIARRSFREQFLGKTARDPLRLEKDIRSVTSSTMSCEAACLAARKALVLIEALYLNVPPADGKAKEFKKTAFRMGTTVEISVVCEDPKKADAAMEKTLAEITRIENLISHFKPESDVSRLNAAAGKEIPVSADTKRCLQHAMLMHHFTAGAFDPTVAPLVELWGFGTGSQPGRIPPKERIQEALARKGMEKVEGLGLNGIPHTARIGAGTSINLSAIGEGFAIDAAVDALRREGVKQGVVNIGGDLFVLGKPAPGSGSRIAVRHPREKDASIASLRIEDAAVCTSGDSDKFFEIEGKRYSHILDPRTGWPVSWQGSVTVVCDDASTADALATALFVLGPETGIALLNGEDIPGQGIKLPGLSDTAALWIEVLPDGTLKQTASKRMKEYLVK